MKQRYEGTVYLGKKFTTEVMASNTQDARYEVARIYQRSHLNIRLVDILPHVSVRRMRLGW